MIGTTLAHYRITAALGAGGMGEVWRATDEKLGREVALKVLPEEFAKDPNRMARFEREAKVLASLNHPNIATLFGLETAIPSGTDSDADSSPKPQAPSPTTFLAMELVEGEDLSDRIKQGSVPVDEAISIALQIAEALEAAHEQGIVHRDLKPANIKVTEDGVVKVLDFGLAKAWETEAGDSSLSLSPTVTHATAAGVILGTAAYMSPEQARGKKVDRRADIWSFGVVLWEMLTGNKLFEGETVSDVLAAVLTREVDFEALSPAVTISTRRLLTRCLERDPRIRLQWIGDARLELQTGDDDLQRELTRPGVRPMAAWVTAAVALLISLLAVGWNVLRPVGAIEEPLHLEVAEAGFHSFSDSAISPDGRRIAFVSKDEDGVYRLKLRRIDSFETQTFPGTEEGENPFFSPDGERVAIFDPEKRALDLVSLSDGSIDRLPDVQIGGYSNSGAWLRDGALVVTSAVIDGDQWPGLAIVSTEGGEARVLTTPSDSGQQHILPEEVPGTPWVLFTVSTEDDFFVAAVSRDTGEQKVVLEHANTPTYLESGHLLAFRPTQNTLVIARFDAESASIQSPPRTVMSEIGIGSRRTGQYGISDNGTLIYNQPTPQNFSVFLADIVLVDRNGNSANLGAELAAWANPRFSADGKQLLLRKISSPHCQLWIRDFERETTIRITFDKDAHDPLWHSNADEVLFAGNVPTGRSVFRAPADGSGAPSLMIEGEVSMHPSSWSADGRRLALAASDLENGGDIWVLDADVGNEPVPFLTSQFSERHPGFSPDGRWIVYTSDESGQSEIFVRPYPGSSGRTQISTEGGIEPRWSPEGTEIFYRAGGKLMAVEVSESEGRIRAGVPTELFDDSYERSSPATPDQINYDVLNDGSLFAMVRPDPASRDTRPLRIVTGWLQEALKTLERE